MAFPLNECISNIPSKLQNFLHNLSSHNYNCCWHFDFFSIIYSVLSGSILRELDQRKYETNEIYIYVVKPAYTLLFWL